MAKKDMTEILTAPDKRITSPQGIKGVLARLYRQMLANLNIGPMTFESHMVDFLSRSRTPNTRSDRQVVQGNLIKDFSKPTMTWPVFCKAIRFFRVWKFRLVIECYHENGKVSLHSVEHQLGRNPAKHFGEPDHLEEDEDDSE